MKTTKAFLIPLMLFFLGFIISYLLFSSGVWLPKDTASYFNATETAPFLEILINNFLMSLLFVAGLGVISSIMIFIQGAVFGGLLGIWLALGSGIYQFIFLFVPHVVLEVMAMVIASYLGFLLLEQLLKKGSSTFRSQISRYFLLFLWVLVLVLLAALTECYLTPYIYKIFCL